MIEDAELLRRYVEEKSEDAFAALVQRHLGLVYACALRRVGGDSQLAEDVAQQVFTDVARRASVLSRRPVLAGWLFTSARFAASKAMRTARRRLEREQEAQIMEKLSHDTTAQIDWERARPVLDDAIGDLNESDREAILLRYFEGCDFSGIGTKLNLSDNAARMRVERALEKLRARLERRGITSTAAALATVLAHQTAVAMPAGLATSVTGAALAGGAIAAGAGIGSGVLAAVTFMTKLQIGIGTALVGGGAIGFVIQAQHNAGLHTEMAMLRQQNQEIASLRAENRRSEDLAAEVSRLRQDDVVLARLRDEAAALQARLQSMARLSAATTPDRATTPPRRLSEKTSAAFGKLKPLQAAKDWSGMLVFLDGLIPQVEPTSYDMAQILDMKAKLYLALEQYSKAIEPWEKALQLSDQFKYFDDKDACDKVYYLAQLRYQCDGLTAEAPQGLWF
ncbi:MAG: sigma-70 family RNA polymerase sigma factor [Verrucomicrobia bacterium]|nr:sigma-70 family RNA polymerase sigma factor [Verrucomicrobiota bacterium]